MVTCFKCTFYGAVIAVLLAMAPFIYQQLDQRAYNARSTAEEAAQPNTFKGKTVIVTGASDGIGVPTAKVLYENGAIVVMACRNLSKADGVRQSILAQLNGHQLDEKNLKVMRLDLSSLQSVNEFVEKFTADYATLNILINNAAVMAFDEYQLSSNGVELQFATNNLGHFYLTQRLTPLLVESAAKTASISRVINTASIGYLFAPLDIESWITSRAKLDDESFYSPFQQYALTKALNIVYAKEYNRRYHKDGVYAVSVHPGAIKSGLQRYNQWMRLLNDYVPDIKFAIKTRSQGAATQIRCAAMTDAEFMANGGQYFENCNAATIWRPDVNNDELGGLFWNLCTSIIEQSGLQI